MFLLEAMGNESLILNVARSIRTKAFSSHLLVTMHLNLEQMCAF